MANNSLPLFQYQDLTEPIDPRFYAPRQIYGSWSEPVRFKVDPRRRVALAASGNALVQAQFGEIVTEDKWGYPWSTPVRFRRINAAEIASGGILVQATPFAEDPLLKWLYQWSEPVRFKKGIGARYQQATTADPSVLPLQKIFPWYAPLSEPVRHKLGLRPEAQQFFTTDTHVIPLTKGIGWYAPLNDPVRVKQALRAALQQAFTIDTKLTPDVTNFLQGWYQWFGEPVRHKLALTTALQRSYTGPDRLLPTPTVDVLIQAIETNNDVALFGIDVFTPEPPVTPVVLANVSIHEIQRIDGGAVSIKVPDG